MAMDVAGQRATRIAKVWSDVLWWVGLLSATVLAVLFLLSPVLMRSGLNQVAVQVTVENAGAPRAQPVPSGDTARASEVVIQERDTTRHLEFRTTDWRMFLIVNWVLLVPILFGLLGIHYLRSFLADVLASDVFTRTNADRLSRLGWLMIAVAVLFPPLQYWRSWIVLRRLDLDGVTLSPASPDWIDGSALFGVLLLVLASVWRYGVELQQERDLTV
jgi:hypothetical protein